MTMKAIHIKCPISRFPLCHLFLHPIAHLSFSVVFSFAMKKKNSIRT